VEGDATGEDDQGQASIFRHVRDQRDDEKRAIDRAEEEDVKMILTEEDRKDREEDDDNDAQAFGRCRGKWISRHGHQKCARSEDGEIRG
jgi:hypothetical protein